MESTEPPRESNAPAPAFAQNIIEQKEEKEKKEKKEEKGISKMPNEKEIQDEINLLETTSNNSYNYLKDYSASFLAKKESLMKEINSYRDRMMAEHKQLNLNDKSSQNQKPGKYESESDFIMATERHLNIMKKINKMYTQIFDSAKLNLDILNRFLERFIKNINNFDDINKDRPFEDFLLDEFKNIVNCWLFMKIDFDKFDFEEALSKHEFEQNFKTFVLNEFKKKNFKLNIICPKGETVDPKEQKRLKEQKENDIRLLTENKSNLIKLRIENAGNISSYIGEKLEFNKLKKLYAENTLITNPSLFKKTKNLEKLIIKSHPNLQIELLEYLPEKIKELHLEKNNFVTFELENILKGILSNNKNILQNLEYLSFAGNNLTRVDLSFLSTKTIFNGLQSMNFQKNKIYKFIYNPENFPNLKFINCCKNNLNKSYLSDIKTLGSLETGNGFLFENELCQKYYNKLKQRLIENKDDLFITKYLNITFIPKIHSFEYFDDLIINYKITNNLKKLDLSYNGLDCKTFFKFVNQNNGFMNVRSLNLNGNEIDDTFFEKFLEHNFFPKLQHLYLNSNKIGDLKIKVNYKDDIPIDEKYNKENDKQLVYKLRLIYKFIQKNTHLNKLTITKNPISELYSVVPEQNNNADKSTKYIKRDNNNIIIINCLFSLLIKVRDELLTKEEEKKTGRKRFNLRFDCRSNVNRNSENYPYSDRPFVKK